jgi:hypothetical protein
MFAFSYSIYILDLFDYSVIGHIMSLLNQLNSRHSLDQQRMKLKTNQNPADHWVPEILKINKRPMKCFDRNSELRAKSLAKLKPE